MNFYKKRLVNRPPCPSIIANPFSRWAKKNLGLKKAKWREKKKKKGASRFSCRNFDGRACVCV